MLLFIAFAVVSCAEDEIIDNEIQTKPGEDVQFGLSLPSSRTVYGNEVNNTFPIYWDNGDKVQIYSPECATGRNDAEYSVKPVSGQSYAESLTKTGDYGVQWGDSAKANFYSVYPSLNAEFSGDGSENSPVTAKMNISNTQEANLSSGTAADMDNVIMYAQTNNVTSGDIVNLQYTPYSTVLKFKVTLGQGNNGYGRVKVSSLTLAAPEDTDIAGDFYLKFNGSNAPTISAAGNNSNSITVSFDTAPILTEANKTTDINVALIPLNITDLTGWTVSLDVYENNAEEVKTYTKTLTGASNLKSGMIHKITLPAIAPAAKWEYDLENWISSLYDYQNIYLTELSLPGAWYAGAPTSKEGYQATDNITTLFNSGVRAFAVECRTSSTISGYSYNPSSVVISGTQSNALFGSHCTGGTRISTVISSIAAAVNGTNEFGVLVLSYADGGSDGHRDQDHAFFIKGIKAEIEASGAGNVIFSEDELGNGITKGTLVKDVLGQLVILVNVDYELSKSDYNDDMNALLTYVPHMDQLIYHLPEGETVVDFSKIRFSPMYWQTWSDNYKVTPLTSPTDNLNLCFASANRTQLNTGTDTSIPTYEKRQTALRSMITHSHDISAAGNHNVWFYFNAGGIQTTTQTAETSKADAQTFANVMNPWLLEVINLKSNGGVDTDGNYTGEKGTFVMSDPSPLGIVMFNQCTNSTYKGPDIVKAIIDMNDKFKLQRYNPNPDPDNGSGGGGTPF